METKLMTGWLVTYINREKEKTEAIYAATALEKDKGQISATRCEVLADQTQYNKTFLQYLIKYQMLLIIYLWSERSPSGL